VSDPVLYGATYSVYTRIARLALEEKGVRYALQEVEIFGPQGVPPEHRQRHPFGRIPVLRHDGFLLYETAAITRYVDEAFPAPALQPRKPQERARMNQLVGILDSYAYRPMIWGVFVQRVSIPREGGTPDESVVVASLPAIETCLQVLEDQLGSRRFLIGAELTLADLHAAPMLMYFAQTAEGLRMLGRRASLRRWLEEMASRPSAARTRGKYG
jgi:glutathione S-transferase